MAAAPGHPSVTPVERFVVYGVYTPEQRSQLVAEGFDIGEAYWADHVELYGPQWQARALALRGFRVEAGPQVEGIDDFPPGRRGLPQLRRDGRGAAGRRGGPSPDGSPVLARNLLRGAGPDRGPGVRRRDGQSLRAGRVLRRSASRARAPDRGGRPLAPPSVRGPEAARHEPDLDAGPHAPDLHRPEPEPGRRRVRHRRRAPTATGARTGSRTRTRSERTTTATTATGGAAAAGRAATAAARPTAARARSPRPRTSGWPTS